VSSSHQRAASWFGPGLPAPSRALRALVLLPLCATLLTGLSACTSTSTADQGAAAVTRSLGAVPIPTAATVEGTETAQPGRPAVLAIGGPVSASLGAVRVLATALGPEQMIFAPPSGTAATKPPLATPAVITLTFTATAGSLPVSTADLSSRNETGRSIRLTPLGKAQGVASPGHPVTLRVSGTFASGAAQITWSSGTHALAIWTFNIELD
jgi:hypothetical protein